MASKCSDGKNTNDTNQPPSREVKEFVSEKPLKFPTFDSSRIYSPHIPSQFTPDPTYNSLLETTGPNQDSCLNEELHGVTSKEPIY